MSTPPLSRNNSSSNLGLNNPTDQKQTIGGSTNSPSADTEKGDGKPWKAAQGGADATKRPTLGMNRPGNLRHFPASRNTAFHILPVTFRRSHCDAFLGCKTFRCNQRRLASQGSV